MFIKATKRSATQVTLIFNTKMTGTLVDLVCINSQIPLAFFFLHSHLWDVSTRATLGSTREDT